MSTAIEIDGRALYPIKEAAQETSYSRDYVTRLAREGKITATNVGRQWFIDLESLKAYAESASLEQEIRRRQLSEDRKLEREARQAIRRRHTLHLKRARTLETRSVAAASLVLSFGLLGGLLTYQLMTYSAAPVTTSIVAVPSESQPAQLRKTTQVRQDNSSAVIASETATRVAQTSSVEESALVADHKTASIGKVEEGILLLPGGVASASATQMFSDPVLVREKTDGLLEVVRVDEFGRAVGNAVPFVVVPVDQSNEGAR